MALVQRGSICMADSAAAACSVGIGALIKMLICIVGTEACRAGLHKSLRRAMRHRCLSMCAVLRIESTERCSRSRLACLDQFRISSQEDETFNSRLDGMKQTPVFVLTEVLDVYVDDEFTSVASRSWTRRISTAALKVWLSQGQDIKIDTEASSAKLSKDIKHHNIAVSSSDTKPTLISKICGGVSEL
ncbi:hypothetical protein SELMODRAFT_425854 [Selaginella moellendorffii]|uniref:Uncharacterized protein n=1 Tax=Selaginella moellendorffii TaxID=88036 RepID=D8SUI3_SELML|nr:hypothetical protein SELMODRAFT_425854 [Selaginella moellendorffii]